jgi:HEPN domain-containing protein
MKKAMLISLSLFITLSNTRLTSYKNPSYLCFLMEKQDHIRYWIQQSEDDWEAVNTLSQGGKNLQSLFFAHLVIEKLCKAIWIKDNESNFPPRTHNLNYLLSQTSIVLSDSFSELLLTLNRFQLEGRYPEYISQVHRLCNDSFTLELINKTNDIRLWLISQLQ